jgi:hypothetical protein
VQDYGGVTPLHFAVEGCNVDVARILLYHGADPTIRDNKGRTPLELGRGCKKEFIEELMRISNVTRVEKEPC